VAFPEINPDFPGLMKPLFASSPLIFTEVHLARLFSTLLGLGTICATYVLSGRLLPNEVWLPEVSAGFVAFIPQFTFLHAYVTNDSLAIFGSSLGMLGLTTVALTKSSSQRRGWLLSGCAVAVALAAKMTTWYLIPLGLLLSAIHIFTRRRTLAESVGDSLGYVAVASSLLFLSAILWPDLVQRLLSSPQSGGINPELMTLAHLRSILPMAHTSFWGMFGWVNMPLPPHLLWPLDAILSIGIAGSLLWLYRHRHRLSTEQHTAVILQISAIGAVFAAYGYFNLTIVQPQSRFLFTAFPAIGLSVALGWMHWAGHYRGITALLLLGILFAVNVTGLATVIFPNFCIG